MAERDVREGVERPTRHLFGSTVMQQCRSAAQHFLRCTPSERQQQNGLRIDALLDQSGDAIGQGPRLSRTGTGDDERRAIFVLYRFELRGIELFFILYAKARLVHRSEI